MGISPLTLVVPALIEKHTRLIAFAGMAEEGHDQRYRDARAIVVGALIGRSASAGPRAIFKSDLSVIASLRGELVRFLDRCLMDCGELFFHERDGDSLGP